MAQLKLAAIDGKFAAAICEVRGGSRVRFFAALRMIA